MERVILFGMGQFFDTIVGILESIKQYQIAEIWDNDGNKQGKIIEVLGEKIEVRKPRREYGEFPIIITSTASEAEIRSQLINEFKIPNKKIKSWNYCLHTVKEQMLHKYKNSNDPQLLKILEYLENNDLDEFNIEGLNNKYALHKEQFKIEKDEINGLLYSWWKDKKIYLKRSFKSEKLAKFYLNGLAREQDQLSPHCYEQEGFEVCQSDVVVDGGAAEGFFSLERVEKVKKIFIVEGDPEWIEALQYTFAPYKDKVEIIDKWLFDEEKEGYITIDEINKKEKISYLKLDIEGAELQALHGASTVLRQDRKMKALICTYHKSSDATDALRLMKAQGFQTVFTSGYMFFPYGDTVSPELRKGLLLANKN